MKRSHSKLPKVKNPGDISTMTIEQLKALAYDELGKIQVANNNLQILQQRIMQMEQMPKPEKDATPPPVNG